MFVLTVFEGDENNELKNAQHHLYKYVLHQIFELSKKTYLLCDEVCMRLGESERQSLIEQKTFDHRTLQSTHDHIAAAFRYEKRDGVLTLFEPNRSLIDKYFWHRYHDWESSSLSDIEMVWAYNWEYFFNENTNKLTAIQSMYPKFIYHVMNAAVFNPNNESGRASEQELLAILSRFFNVNLK